MNVPTTICPGCGACDPEVVLVDSGIGYYEFWGARGYHRDEHWLTKCCETQAESFWPEPNDNLIPEAQVAL